jgi:hypothetical protein
MKKRKGMKLLFALVAVPLAAGLLGALVMLLWNALIPEIFTGGPEITFFQAIGLFILGRVLFGRVNFKCHRSWKGGHCKGRLDSKLASMTDEEREKYQSEYSHRFSCGKGSKEE